MRVEYALPVRGIERLADGTFMLAGLESNLLSVPSLPQPAQVIVMACVCVPHHEVTAGRAGTLTCRVLNPQMEPAAPDLSIEVDVQRSPELPDGWDTRVLLPIGMAFEINSTGAYSVELASDSTTVSVALLIVSSST